MIGIGVVASLGAFAYEKMSELSQRTNEPRQLTVQEKQELINQREQREQQSTACPPARTTRAPPRPITPVS